MAPHVRLLVARDTKYALAPFWIVLLVLIGAGFAVLSAYAIGRHFFPPAAVTPTINENERGKLPLPSAQRVVSNRFNRHDANAIPKTDSTPQSRAAAGRLWLQRYTPAAS